jgi:hypothetical protein
MERVVKIVILSVGIMRKMNSIYFNIKKENVTLNIIIYQPHHEKKIIAEEIIKKK